MRSQRKSGLLSGRSDLCNAFLQPVHMYLAHVKIILCVAKKKASLNLES